MKETIRAASYRRVSTPGQAREGLSLRDQQERIQRFIRERGWTFIEEYEDAGKSAAEDYRTRPAFCRMIQDANNGRFDCIVVYDLERFCRNPEDYYPLIRVLEERGVKVVTLDNPDFDSADPNQQLFRNIKIAFGKWQKEKARLDSILRKQGKLDRGGFNIGCRLPFGLRWNNREGTALELHPEHIRVWNLIKRLRRAGWGYKQIAAALNGETTYSGEPIKVDDNLLRDTGVTLPVPSGYGGKGWYDSGIAAMFRDECRVSGELKFTFAGLDGEARPYRVPFPPMMSQEEWDFFSELSDHHLTWKPRKVGRGSVLSRLCRCEKCGGNIVVTGHSKPTSKNKNQQYYGCINRLNKPRKGKRCDLPFIPKARLEDKVLRELAEFLHDDKAFQRAIQRASATVRSNLSALDRLQEEEALLTVEFNGIDGRMGRLLDAIEYGTLTKEEAKARRQEIDRDKARLSRRLDELAHRKALLERDTDTVRQVEVSRSKFAAIISRWERMDSLSKEDKQELLHALLPRTAGCGIIVGVVGEHNGNDERDPEPIGSVWVQITGMLQLTEDSPSLLHQAVGGDSE